MVIGAAIAVHRELGPGIEEAAYEEALSARLTALGVRYECQKALPLLYKDVVLDCGYRIDLVVEERLLLELKAIARILPVYEAQLLTYLRLGPYPLGLLLDFEVPVLRDGIWRRVLTKPQTNVAGSKARGHDPFDSLSAGIIQAAFEVHRTLGPGLIRSVYQECLCYELSLRGIDFTRDCHVPLHLEGNELQHGVTIPLVVAGTVPVFCLSVARLNQLHGSTLLARLRQTQSPYGFLINFNAPVLTEGVRRLTL